MLEFAYRSFALGMIVIEVVEDRGGFGRALSKHRKQQPALLGVMDRLGKLVDVEEHRAQGRHIGD